LISSNNPRPSKESHPSKPASHTEESPFPPIISIPADVKIQSQDHAKNIRHLFHQSQMKPSSPSNNKSLLSQVRGYEGDKVNKVKVVGMALMSTQPRDYPFIHQIAESLEQINEKICDTKIRNEEQVQDTNSIEVIRCFGVHPWFLKEANMDFPLGSGDPSKCTDISPQDEGSAQKGSDAEMIMSNSNSSFGWFLHLQHYLSTHPNTCVGEIGLDGVRFDIIDGEKVLACPMDIQVMAFEAQLHLAADLDKCVSIHVVKAWGEFITSLKKVLTERLKRRKEQRNRWKQYKATTGKTLLDEKEILVLPPRMYFHAFGGNEAILKQLDAIVKDHSSIYFGFAPIVNFRKKSMNEKKMNSILQKIGIDRLVLESDLEDYICVESELLFGADFIAKALGIDTNDVIEQTMDNAKRLYNI